MYRLTKIQKLKKKIQGKGNKQKGSTGYLRCGYIQCRRVACFVKLVMLLTIDIDCNEES